MKLWSSATRYGDASFPTRCTRSTDLSTIKYTKMSLPSTGLANYHHTFFMTFFWVNLQAEMSSTDTSIHYFLLLLLYHLPDIIYTSVVDEVVV